MTGESGVSGDGADRRKCYNPLCDETLTCDPRTREGYCCWNCAVMARSGAADRILQESGQHV